MHTLIQTHAIDLVLSSCIHKCCPQAWEVYCPFYWLPPQSGNIDSDDIVNTQWTDTAYIRKWWCLSAQESPQAPHPVSQMFPQVLLVKLVHSNHKMFHTIGSVTTLGNRGGPNTWDSVQESGCHWPLPKHLVLGQQLKDVRQLHSQQVTFTSSSQVVLLPVDGFLQEWQQLLCKLPKPI